MAKRTWRVQGKSAEHTVRLEHSYISGKATVTVDGAIVYHRHRKWDDPGFEVKLMIDGVECWVEASVFPWGFVFSYRLSIEGKIRPAH